MDNVLKRKDEFLLELADLMERYKFEAIFSSSFNGESNIQEIDLICTDTLTECSIYNEEWSMGINADNLRKIANKTKSLARPSAALE